MAFYEENKKRLDEAVNTLPPAAQAAIDDDIGQLVDEVGEAFGLTMGEIGEICELVRQVMTRELKRE